MTSGWDYELTAAAERDVRRLDRHTLQRITDALDRLVGTPSQGDVRQLAGSLDIWRLRVGDWRIRFRLEPETRTVVVLRVQRRDRAYRR